jgi:hypothetical protein
VEIENIYLPGVPTMMNNSGPSPRLSIAKYLIRGNRVRAYTGNKSAEYLVKIR